MSVINTSTRSQTLLGGSGSEVSNTSTRSQVLLGGSGLTVDNSSTRVQILQTITQAALPAPPSGNQTRIAESQIQRVVRNVTGDITLIASDNNGFVRCVDNIPQTITVPTYASVPFPPGTIINLRLAGTSTMTVVGAVGVTLLEAGDSFLDTQHTSISLLNIGIDEWIVTDI